MTEFKVGATYITNGGARVGPLLAGEQYPEGPWLFKFGSDHYDRQGKSFRSGFDDDRSEKYDLAHEYKPEGPTCTVMRRVIVPGEYGSVVVGHVGESYVNIKFNKDYHSATEIRSICMTLSQLAEALEDQK